MQENKWRVGIVIGVRTIRLLNVIHWMYRATVENMHYKSEICIGTGRRAAAGLQGGKWGRLMPGGDLVKPCKKGAGV